MTSEFTPLGFPDTSFLTILFIALPTVICLFLLIAYFFEFLNHSHPDRKVQKSRLNRIKEIELRKTPGSIFTVALCISTGIYAQLQGWALTPVSLTWWSAPVFL
jgi:Delta7-sterol 5-desaturase